MKLFVFAIFIIMTISAHAEEEEWAEVDWSQVLPIQERPGFWDGRDIRKKNQSMPPTRGSRIVGGQIVVPHSHPWQAGLLILYQGSTFVCGGSLLTTTRVLTAAHCVVGSTSTQVILGAHQITTVESTQQRRTVFPGNYRNHPQYNPSTLNNDVTVLILPTAVTITNQVRTIPFVGASAPTFAGVTATMTGWGATSDTSSTSSVLRGTTNTVITNAQCIQVWGSQNFLPSTLCTSTAGGRGICGGDSGGPLTAIHNNVRQLIGVTSWGASSCFSPAPNGFARVSSFATWISSHL